ncbi:MAG: hypothetical protein AB7H86_17170 [Blastocatellales bacterium]
MEIKILVKRVGCYILPLIVVGYSAVYKSENTIVINTQQPKSEFRYIIYSNEVDDTGRAKDTRRVIKILLDEKAFSEQTLKTLFYLLSKRYSDPDWLEVEVYTNLKQIPTPEENDLGWISEVDSDPEFDKFHRSFLMRYDGNEFFRYNPTPPSRKLKTVIIKGRDPYGPNK